MKLQAKIDNYKKFQVGMFLENFILLFVSMTDKDKMVPKAITLNLKSKISSYFMTKMFSYSWPNLT